LANHLQTARYLSKIHVALLQLCVLATCGVWRCRPCCHTGPHYIHDTPLLRRYVEWNLSWSCWPSNRLFRYSHRISQGKCIATKHDPYNSSYL